MEPCCLPGQENGSISHGDPLHCKGWFYTCSFLWLWVNTVLFQLPAVPKSLQSCPTLCDPIDGCPPGSAIPGILQARVLEWVAIAFSHYFSLLYMFSVLSNLASCTGVFPGWYLPAFWSWPHSCHCLFCDAAQPTSETIILHCIFGIS